MDSWFEMGCLLTVKSNCLLDHRAVAKRRAQSSELYRLAALRKMRRKAGIKAYFKPVNASQGSDQDAKSQSEENEVQIPSNSMMGSMMSSKNLENLYCHRQGRSHSQNRHEKTTMRSTTATSNNKRRALSPIARHGNINLADESQIKQSSGKKKVRLNGQASCLQESSHDDPVMQVLSNLVTFIHHYHFCTFVYKFPY